MAAQPRIRLLIVDDHAMFREGLRAVLERQPDFVVVGEAGDADNAVRLARELTPDVILMDLHLGASSGVDATRLILAQEPAVRIIALTMYQDDDLIAAMFGAGAQGYILKESRGAALMHAVRTVAAGGAAIDPHVGARLLDAYRQDRPQRAVPPTALPISEQPSERDLDCLRLLRAGKTNREIAKTLSLSEQTVKNILSLLYAKLNVSNRTEAVAVALQSNLIPSN
ncbi:MAG: response regulator transcription factor [Chloroflexi bacterium]|nr:response regulator transcription factor [Chloroflexota bacterium]